MTKVTDLAMEMGLPDLLGTSPLTGVPQVEKLPNYGQSERDATLPALKEEEEATSQETQGPLDWKSEETDAPLEPPERNAVLSTP